jgi:hypothetical protein
MSKRFTETGKWSKAWFQDLPAKHKLLWLYLCDNCDCAGFWSVNWRQASFQIGEAVGQEDVQAFGDRLAMVDADTLHIVTFVEFQYGNLSEACKAHIPILKALKARVSKGYAKGIHTLQEKDKDKEMDPVPPEGVQGEPTPAATTEPPIEAQAAEVYAAYPLKVGKPAALRAIRAAIGKHGFDFVKLRTVAFAAARGADKEFLAHPSTWFNQERYNDDPSTWIRSAAPPKPSRNDGTFNAGKENDYANAAI